MKCRICSGKMTVVGYEKGTTYIIFECDKCFRKLETYITREEYLFSEDFKIEPEAP